MPVVEVTGPLGADSDQVVVTKVSENATALTVYQDTGAGMTMIGTKTEGVTEGVNSVTVTGLVKGAKVAATQTIDGQEGCTPPDGIGVIVGGGANPRIRIAFSLQENPTATGPVGANGTNGRTSMIHFAPATSLYGGAPGDGALIIYPSNDWQTVTIDLGRQGIGEAANVAGEPGPAPDYSGYSPGNTVAVQVYAYKEFGGNRVYSPVGAASPVVTSNEMFTVTWTWDAVEGADGYRLLRLERQRFYRERGCYRRYHATRHRLLQPIGRKAKSPSPRPCKPHRPWREPHPSVTAWWPASGQSGIHRPRQR